MMKNFKNTDQEKKDLQFSLSSLYEVIEKRKSADFSSSYVAHLFHQGNEKILKKMHEECFEVIFAAQSESKLKLSQELADLWFHLLVVMSHYEIKLDTIVDILKKRSELKKDK